MDWQEQKYSCPRAHVASTRCAAPTLRGASIDLRLGQEWPLRTSAATSRRQRRGVCACAQVVIRPVRRANRLALQPVALRRRPRLPGSAGPAPGGRAGPFLVGAARAASKNAPPCKGPRLTAPFARRAGTRHRVGAGVRRIRTAIPWPRNERYVFLYLTTDSRFGEAHISSFQVFGDDTNLQGFHAPKLPAPATVEKDTKKPQAKGPGLLTKLQC